MNKMLVDLRQRFACLLMVLAIFASVQTEAAQAESSLSMSLAKAERDCDQLVKGVQASLTLQGKWPPPAASQEMKLCQALSLFQKQLRSLTRRNQDPGDPRSQAGVQQLKASASNLQQILGSVNANPAVSMQWMALNTDVNAAVAALYTTPPPWSNERRGSSPWNNGSLKVSNSAYSESLRQIERDTGSFVSAATVFLRTSGQLSAAPSGAAGQFTAALYSFQSLLQKLSRQSGAQLSLSAQQMQVQQLMSSALNVEQAMNTLGATSQLSPGWMQVRYGLNSLARTTYAVNPWSNKNSPCGQYPWRRGPYCGTHREYVNPDADGDDFDLGRYFRHWVSP